MAWLYLGDVGNIGGWFVLKRFGFYMKRDINLECGFRTWNEGIKYQSY